MQNTVPTTKLENSRENISIPQIGFGVSAIEKELVAGCVSAAIKCGYRLFDNARFYGNEAEVGAALRSEDIPRDELFISTKLPNACHAYKDAIAACERSLKIMGLDYFDMYMIHFPMPTLGLYTEAWSALERLHKDGKVRVIGLSNFKEHHVNEILRVCSIKPMVNELEINPYYAQKQLRKFCQSEGIHVINWFPLGGPRDPLIPYPMENFKVLLDDPYLQILGDKYGKTISQIALRWAVEHNMTPIPKSKNPARMRENTEIFDFSLTNEEISDIDALDHDRRLGPDSDVYNDLQE